MVGRLNVSAMRLVATPAAALATSSGQLPPIGTPPGQLGVVQGQGTVAFTLNGVPRWVIDVSRFGGTPNLTVTTTPQQTTTITLKNAQFPGTQISADLVLVVRQTGPLGTPGDFAFTFGGFHGQVILEQWLAGNQVMQATITLHDDVCPLGTASKLAASGSAHARFLPSWLMAIDGSSIAGISGLGPAISSDSLVIQLLSPTDPSINNHPKSKRTLLTLFAGTREWELTPVVTDLGIGRLAAARGLFNRIEIEAGEGSTGDVSRELLATSPGVVGLTLALAGGISDLDGHPFSLALAAPSYAIAFDASTDHSQGDQTFLTARFGPSPAWLVADGFALQVGDAAGPPGFEAETLRQTVTSVRCRPALIAVAAPMSGSPGVAAQPIMLADALLPIVASLGTSPGWGIAVGPNVPGRPRMSLPDFAVSMLRRDDLFALDFLFFNLALEAGGGNPPQIVRKDPSQASYLVARFNSPQNIAEQAYLEEFTDTGGHPAPPGGDLQNFGAETPGTGSFPLIAQARAAGPSRLAFRVPTGTDALPFSLNELLSWAKLEQSVVPVAQAPDPHQTGVPEPPKIVPLPAIREPQATETAIEAPWRLYLSPNYSGAWAHSATPVTLGARTELWHTRLAVRAAARARLHRR